MKRLLIIMVVFCATLAFGYLVGAFVAADMDISTWNGEAKASLAFISIVCGSVMAIIAEVYTK